MHKGGWTTEGRGRVDKTSRRHHHSQREMGWGMRTVHAIKPEEGDIKGDKGRGTLEREWNPLVAMASKKSTT